MHTDTSADAIDADEFNPLAVTEEEEEAYNQGWLAREYGPAVEPPTKPKLRRAFEMGWRAAERHAEEPDA